MLGEQPRGGLRCADRATDKVTVHNPRNSAVSVTLPQAPLFSPFTAFPKHRVFHSVSISLMFRTFHPFRSLQATPSQPPEPMKYPLAISLTVLAHSPLSYSHAQPLQLSLQLTAPGIHQHLLCSCKNSSSPRKQLANFIRNERANNNPHCTLFSALFGAISSLLRIRMQLKSCLIFYGCEFQVPDIL